MNPPPATRHPPPDPEERILVPLRATRRQRGAWRWAQNRLGITLDEFLARGADQLLREFVKSRGGRAPQDIADYLQGRDRPPT